MVSTTLDVDRPGKHTSKYLVPPPQTLTRLRSECSLNRLCATSSVRSQRVLYIRLCFLVIVNLNLSCKYGVITVDQVRGIECLSRLLNDFQCLDRLSRSLFKTPVPTIRKAIDNGSRPVYHQTIIYVQITCLLTFFRKHHWLPTQYT